MQPVFLHEPYCRCLCRCQDLRLIQTASDEIMTSSRLRKIFAILLHLGNRINTAGMGAKQPAAAIRLESLIHLTQDKAYDRKTSFLQYGASVIRRSCPDLVLIMKDLPSLGRAEIIGWDQLQDELENLESSLTIIRQMALSHGQHHDEGEYASSTDKEVAVLQSTNIGRFTVDACIRMASVYHEMEATKESTVALFSYFGEDEGCHVTDGCNGSQSIFRTLSQFANQFEHAGEQSMARDKELLLRDCSALANSNKRDAAPAQMIDRHPRPTSSLSCGRLENFLLVCLTKIDNIRF